MKLHELNEGLLDFLFGKKEEKKERELLPLTDEQRDTIRKYFKKSNVDIRFAGPGSKYVLEFNAKATHGRGEIHFRNEDGQLKALVAHYGNASDVGDSKKIPITHTTVVFDSEDDIKKLMKELDFN
jgi:hypothetical protein